MGSVRNPLRALSGGADGGQDAETLMARVSRGDTAAFAALYDEIAPTVHGVVLRVVRDPARAEEVTQEVFVELWRVATRFDPNRGSVRSWAATLAHRRAVDCVRSEQSHRARSEKVGRLEPGTSEGPAEMVEGRLDRERVHRGLAELTELQRESVELAYFGGYSYREVAMLLDVPEGTVKTRIRDGLIRLRDTLGVTS